MMGLLDGMVAAWTFDEDGARSYEVVDGQLVPVLAAAVKQVWEDIPPALVAAYLYSFVFTN